MLNLGGSSSRRGPSTSFVHVVRLGRPSVSSVRAVRLVRPGRPSGTSVRDVPFELYQRLCVSMQACNSKQKQPVEVANRILKGMIHA